MPSDLTRHKLTRQEIWLVFAVAAFPIHFWAWLNFLREVPAYILHVKIWDILGILAYVQAYALLESLLVLATLIFLAYITPRRFLQERFVPQGAILAIIPALWMIPFHYQNRIAQALSMQVTGYVIFLATWLFTFIIALLDLSLIFRRHPRFEAGLCSFADKLTVLATVYIILDILGIILIFIRNLIG
jgi:hypothetical protein